MTSPLGAVLTLPPPEFPAERALQVLDDFWGKTGALRRLAAERDVNYHVETGDGEFVLKLANPAEPAAETDLQNQVLLWLQGRGLPVPQVVPMPDGRIEASLPEGRVRLLTYLQGQPLHATPRSDGQRRAIGAMSGRLVRALRGFRHPAARRYLIWDIQNCGRLRPLLPAIADRGLRELARWGIGCFDQQLAPLLADLPTQVVHNDLNPHNVLVAADDPDRVAGFLDFGDMVETPRILDLGVTASYLLDPDRPAESLLLLAQAYQGENPLSAAELRLLPQATVARLVTSLCIPHERARLFPDNAAYILRNVPVASRALRAMATLPADLSDRLETLA